MKLSQDNMSLFYISLGVYQLLSSTHVTIDLFRFEFGKGSRPLSPVFIQAKAACDDVRIVNISL